VTPFRNAATNWARGWPVQDAPDEMVEFSLLERLSGYTRATLAEEPAYVVQHWLTMIEEDAKSQNQRSQSAKR